MVEMRDIDWWHSHENNITNGNSIRFELFVRTLGAPPGSHSRQSRILDRIDRFDRRGDVDTSRTTVWGDSVCVSECCADHRVVRSVRDRIDQFRKWGQERRAVTVGFDRREVDSTITDERFDVIDLPTVCLAVYVDAGLEGLFPVDIGGRKWSVEQYLDWFERACERSDVATLADA